MHDREQQDDDPILDKPSQAEGEDDPEKTQPLLGS